MRRDVNVTSVPSIPGMLPVLPLRDTVVFPLSVMPLHVGQERSIKLVDDAMRTHRLVALVTQLKPETRQAGPKDLYQVGCAAVIHQLLRAQDGTMQLVVQGLERIRVGDFVQTEPYLIAKVQPAPEVETPGTEVEALTRTARSLFERILALNPNIQGDVTRVLQDLGSPSQIAYLIAATVPFSTAQRQEILEADSAVTKLRLEIELLQRELAIREMEKKITEETQQNLSKTQRDYMLREQMRTIQKQLGEEDPGRAGLQELRRKLDQAQLPEDARKEAEREFSRLEQMQPGSPEYGMLQSYLDWLGSLPWGRYTGAPIDIGKARVILDEDHYDLEKIKERILDYLAVQKLRQDRNVGAKDSAPAAAGSTGPLPITAEDEARREPILCFVGPPGVGKTSLGQSIARSMGRKFVRISLGGVHDEAEIRGHRRTYIGALPGRIIQALRRAEAADPVFMLDEVDKMSASFHGDPAAALLEVLDPAQNNTFVDTYLGVPFDLSKVLFICTANTMDTIPAPLMDRMEVLNLSGYTEQEKLHIARRYLLPKQIQANGLLESELRIDDEALRRVIGDYTREAGVRNLERRIAEIARKAARQITEKGPTTIEVHADDIPKLLGRPRFFNELVERIDRPGIATGLAWTPTGGEILFVETAMVPGREGLVLTGMLGDVMRESAQAALSYVRSNATQLGLDPKSFEGKSIHVHVPAGAIPKDGPSAGVAITTALASLAKGSPVRNDTAMTGEITLRGKVLPVGGIKEKVLAAYRAGVKVVILPERNQDALDDVPEEVRKAIQFHFADSAEKVLEIALGPMPKPEQQPARPSGQPPAPPPMH
ncbi:MAG TPA: endopeptidase La [Myxococcaceae bacterium]|nr:endopeptidase La [Myxococcaceae bacterium]